MGFIWKKKRFKKCAYCRKNEIRVEFEMCDECRRKTGTVRVK